MEHHRSRFRIEQWWHWLFGLAAFLWIALRSGTNPKRLVYPCQQAASPVAAQWILAVAALFVGSPLLRRIARYSPLPVIAIGGIALLYFTVFDRPWALKSGDHAPVLSKLVAAVTVLMWTGVIIYGRLLPYLEGG